MHVLLLAPGVSVHSQRFLQMLLEAGIKVTLVDTDNPPTEAEGSGRYKFIPYPHAWGMERYRRLNRTVLVPWSIGLQLRAIAAITSPQIVHVHWANTRAYHCALAGLHPLVITCWGSDINDAIARETYGAAHRKRLAYGLAHADHITADSADILAKCEEIANQKLQTSLWFFGVDFDEFKPLGTHHRDEFRRQLGVPSRGKLILSVRALRPAMGHHYVLEAFARARLRVQEELHLVFMRYGAIDDGYQTQLREEANRLGLAECVHWIGPLSHEQMPQLYNSTDIVVNFPTRDAFPVTFFEVAACKKPTVSSNLMAYHKTFAVQAFRMVEPGDIDGLSSALVHELQEDSGQKEESLEQSRRLACTVGSKQSNFESLIRLYDHLINKRRENKK